MASIKYGSGGNSASASYASADSKSCTIGLKDASLNLQIPCPVGTSYISFTGDAKYGTDSKGKVSFADEEVPGTNDCKRKIKLTITFPKGGGGGEIGSSALGDLIGASYIGHIYWSTSDYKIHGTKYKFKWENNKIVRVNLPDDTIDTTPWTNMGTTTPT
jgi:hypothetical protein